MLETLSVSGNVALKPEWGEKNVRPIHASKVENSAPEIIKEVTRGVQKVRGPTKKENEFYDETRCEGCDVSKTTPDAVTSQSVLLLGSGCWLL